MRVINTNNGKQNKGSRKRNKTIQAPVIIDDGAFSKKSCWKLVGAPYENEVKDLLANDVRIEDVRKYLKKRYDVEVTYTAVLQYRNTHVIINKSAPALIDKNLDERTKELLESARYYQDNLLMVTNELKWRKTIADSIVADYVKEYIEEKKDEYGDNIIKYGTDIEKITDIIIEKMSPDQLTEMIRYRDKVFNPTTIEKLMRTGNELFNNLMTALSSFGIRITKVSEEEELQAKAFIQSIIDKSKKDVKV